MPGDLRLPPSIGGLRELRRAIRELEAAENALVSGQIKNKAGLAPASLELPKLAEELLTLNKLEVRSSADLAGLRKALDQMSGTSPRCKFIFAGDVDAPFLARLVSWMRDNVSPQLLVDVTVSPPIAGGFILETPVRRYDFSWRRLFDTQGSRFADLLRGSGNGQ